MPVCNGPYATRTHNPKGAGAVPYVAELRLGDGSTLLLEADGEQPPGVGRVARGGALVREGAETLQEALERLRPALDALVSGVRGAARAPSEVTVGFGIKLSAEAGVVISKAATEANFTVTAKWTNIGQGS
jgi:hypothetical protein